MTESCALTNRMGTFIFVLFTYKYI